jgi:hypothetical protein
MNDLTKWHNDVIGQRAVDALIKHDFKPIGKWRSNIFWTHSRRGHHRDGRGKDEK